MNMISYKEVPGTYLHCIHADCPMASHCLRQLAMQTMPNDYTAVSVVNPKLTKQSAECEFYRNDAPQVYGKGFKNMQKQMLPGQYETFSYRLQGKFGRTGYFERRRGERLCSPREIQIVNDVLKVTMFAVANRYVRLLNSLSGAASPLPLCSPSVCFS